MLAFYSIVVDPQDHLTVTEGTLHSIPIELKDIPRVSSYSKLQKSGWHTTEFGYSTLVMHDDRGTKYIIPGLYLTDAPKPIKRFHGYSPAFSKIQVERYLTEHIERSAQIFSVSEAELTGLVHDLRHLSTSIYHSAVEADNAIRAAKDHRIGDKIETILKSYRTLKNGLRENIKTVIATQTMLKVRTDYLDFTNDTEVFDEIADIPVYRRVDKVIRCFRASARNKAIDIKLRGRSHRLAEGPNFLDIIPYTLMDNAIKYSPKNRDIVVQVNDLDGRTVVFVTSIGPRLEDSETARIFDKGFRGSEAIRMRNAGTGLGLAVAAEVIGMFGGEISVEQNFEDQEARYAEITFRFSIPTKPDPDAPSGNARPKPRRRKRHRKS